MSFGRWLGLIALVASLLLLWSLREAVVLIFAAIILAMAVCTLVGAVRQRLQCGRPLALALTLISILLLVAIVATAMIPPFAAQFTQLLAKLPAAAHALVNLLQQGLESGSRMIYGSSDGGIAWLRQTLGRPGDGTTALATGLGGALRLVDLAGNVGTVLVQTLFVLAVALMITAQPEAYREAVLLLTPSFYRRRFRQVLLACGEALSAWMVGVLISSLCVGILAAIGLSLLGVKLVAANAMLAGLLNVIPNIGPTLSTLFPMSVALLDAPWKALAVLVLYIVIQNLESYLITPSVMHHQLRLLPGLTLTAQLLFTVLFGPLGLLLALPLAVCLQVLLREVVIHDILDGWKPRRFSP
ncbi:MAG: AI-2E family transporter [Synechococcaceae cyanobacterium]|nr:AI-2E family transporter [Synechococcaceae cyanobacterium]